MAKNYYLKYTREAIKLSSKPFAGGGEGNLYKITSPAKYQNYVAKIYHPQKRTDIREKKTQYLIEHPPIGISESGSIVWIKDALYDANYQFIGFIMPFVRGEKLEMLTMGKLPKKLKKEWHRFDLKKEDALKYRLRIGFNLAAAIYQMHATDNYVLVDMKPENIIIQANGLLAIVDTDSVEVIENGEAIFPAPVATPEYTPPEFYTNTFRKNATVGESWDRFGLAVILYKLLFGIHPFTGSAKAPYDNLVSLDEKIEHGFFVHSKKKGHYLKVIPPPHRKFHEIDETLKDLFIQCFEHGHENPDLRPTANEWCSALLLAIGDPKLEAHFAHILGMWGGSSSVSFKMPSRLFQQRESDMDLKVWFKQKIDSLYEMPPQLPIALHQLFSKGQQDIKLSLEATDYLISWGGTISFLLLLTVFHQGFHNWVMTDFWLWSVVSINLVVIALFMLPQFIIPRIVSLCRHSFSNQVKLRQLWTEFRLRYPQLQKDALSVKQDLFNSMFNKVDDYYNKIKKESSSIVKPLKVYLKDQDQLVKQLIEERKVVLDGIIASFLSQANENNLLNEINGRSLKDLEKKLTYYRKNNLLNIELEVRSELKKTAIYQEADKVYEKKLKEVVEEENALQDELTEKAKVLYDINAFLDKHFDGKATERDYLDSIFKENEIKSLLDIKVVLDSNGGILIGRRGLDSYSKETYVEVPVTKVKSVLKLKNSILKYMPLVEDVIKKDIEYAVEFFQENYGEKKIIFEELKKKLHRTFLTTVKKELDELTTTITEKREVEFEKAKELLASLIEKQIEEVEKAERLFEERYKTIYADSEHKVQDATEKLDKLNKKQKIAVDDLLNSPIVQKSKIELENRIKQIEKDIAYLEELKTD